MRDAPRRSDRRRENRRFTRDERWLHARVEPSSNLSKTKRAREDLVDLADPSLYVNRELSLLEFERRVLAQARDPSTPLLERLRFLTICSTNLDEFFEIRVSGLRQHEAAGVSRP